MGWARHYFEAAGQTSKRFGQNSAKLNSKATIGPSSWSWPGLVKFAARRACSNLEFYLTWKSHSIASSIEDLARYSYLRSDWYFDSYNFIAFQFLGWLSRCLTSACSWCSVEHRPHCSSLKSPTVSWRAVLQSLKGADIASSGSASIFAALVYRSASSGCYSCSELSKKLLISFLTSSLRCSNPFLIRSWHSSGHQYLDFGSSFERNWEPNSWPFQI